MQAVILWTSLLSPPLLKHKWGLSSLKVWTYCSVTSHSSSETYRFLPTFQPRALPCSTHTSTHTDKRTEKWWSVPSAKEQWLPSLNLQYASVLSLSPLHFLVLKDQVLFHRCEILAQHFPEHTLSLGRYYLHVGVVKPSTMTHLGATHSPLLDPVGCHVC